jgi:hypothetical protein
MATYADYKKVGLSSFQWITGVWQTATRCDFLLECIRQAGWIRRLGKRAIEKDGLFYIGVRPHLYIEEYAKGTPSKRPPAPDRYRQ